MAKGNHLLNGINLQATHIETKRPKGAFKYCITVVK